METIDMKNVFESSGFKLVSPVKKLNIDNPKIAIGVILMTDPEYKKLLDENINIEGINDDTILFFEQRHLYELGAILLGVFLVLKESNNSSIISIDNVCYYTTDLLNIASEYKSYHYFLLRINESIQDLCIPKYNNDLLERITYILHKIWFLGYDSIDKLMQISADAYRKDTRENERESISDDE